MTEENTAKESELAKFLSMPCGDLNGIKCKEHRIEEAKNALKIKLNAAKTEQPNVPVKKFLLDYWNNVEAHNCYMRQEQMNEVCKTYLAAIRQMGLYEKLETFVGKLNE